MIRKLLVRWLMPEIQHQLSKDIGKRISDSIRKAAPVLVDSARRKW